jgi:hypothetical protein
MLKNHSWFFETQVVRACGYCIARLCTPALLSQHKPQRIQSTALPRFQGCDTRSKATPSCLMPQSQHQHTKGAAQQPHMARLCSRRPLLTPICAWTPFATYPETSSHSHKNLSHSKALTGAACTSHRATACVADGVWWWHPSVTGCSTRPFPSMGQPQPEHHHPTKYTDKTSQVPQRSDSQLLLRRAFTCSVRAGPCVRLWSVCGC